MTLLLSIVVFPFVVPFFLLMVLRDALGLNPYHVTLQYWPMWQNALWVAALVKPYSLRSGRLRRFRLLVEWLIWRMEDNL